MMGDVQWPEMNDAQRELLESVVERFKKKLKDIADETISQLYVDILPHLESDTFLNFKNDAMSAVKGYARNCALKQSDYEGLEIRNMIFKEHKAELIELINLDNLERIKTLEKYLKEEREYRR